MVVSVPAPAMMGKAIGTTVPESADGSSLKREPGMSMTEKRIRVADITSVKSSISF